jgi:hypothetical protein
MKRSFNVVTRFYFIAIFLICCWFFIPSNVFGQIKAKDIKLEFGNEERLYSGVGGIIGYDEKGIYVIRINNSKSVSNYYTSYASLDFFNQDLNLIKSSQLEFKEGKQKELLEFVVQMNNRLYAFTSHRNKKIKQKILSVQELNKKNLEKTGEKKQVAKIDYSGYKKFESGWFDIELSKDSSKLVVYYDLPYKQKENERFGFHVFDQNMNLIWEEQVTYPFASNQFSVKEYNVDNQGNVYVVGSYYDDSKKQKSPEFKNIKFYVLGYLNNGNDFKKYKVEFEDKYPLSMIITFDKHGNILCAGFYIGENGVSHGSYFIKIDPDSEQIIMKNYLKFDSGLITQHMKEGEAKRTKSKIEKGKEIGLRDIRLRHIIHRTDGGLVLVGEQYYNRIESDFSTNSTTGTTTTTTDLSFHYNDIIVVNITPEGKIDWAQKILKRQVTLNDNGIKSSYALAVVKDKLYFIFNEHSKNLTYSGNGKFKKFEGDLESNCVIVELNNEGNQKKYQLFNSKEFKLVARPIINSQINDNVLIFYNQGKRSRFAKVTFN